MKTKIPVLDFWASCVVLSTKNWFALDSKTIKESIQINLSDRNGVYVSDINDGIIIRYLVDLVSKIATMEEIKRILLDAESVFPFGEGKKGLFNALTGYLCFTDKTKYRLDENAMKTMKNEDGLSAYEFANRGAK